MSADQRRFEQMMTGHIDRQVKQQREQELSPEARRHFARPAYVCEVCGKPMDIDPDTGREHIVTEWERKWSVHRFCAEMVQSQLDRRTGISSERRR